MAEDRTSEFLSLARSMPPGPTTSGMGGSNLSANGGRYSRDGGKSTTTNASSYSQLKDFHTTAGGISRDIASTSQLLADLAQMVKQKSLFQDDTRKVNELVVRIKSSIENLNGRLEDAGRQIAQQKRTLGANSQAGQEASNVVGQLKEEFTEAAAGFKRVLQQRTDVLKETDDRKRQIYGQTTDDDMDIPILNLENKPPVYGDSSMGMGGFPTLDLTSGMTAGESTSSGSQLPRPRKYWTNYTTWMVSLKCKLTRVLVHYPIFLLFFEKCMILDGAASFGDNGLRMRKGSDLGTYSAASSYYGRQDSTPLTPWDIQRMEQESGQGQMMQLIPDQTYLSERADAMEQVESHIVELGTIFNKLAVMVSEHRDMVQRVEDNVDEANSTINLSLNSLADTLTNLQTNRALFFKVFGILVTFIIMFIIFFA